MSTSDKLADALRNMVGVFDSPVRCLKFPTEFGDTACRIARETLADYQVDDALGRFGHHPDPATDFEVEVTSLQGRLFNAKHAIPDKHGVTESVAQVADAIKRAMTFRVGGVETSVRAKSILRALELDAAQPPAPGDTEHGLTSKQAWWAGVRIGLGLPPDCPRTEVAAVLAQRRMPDAVRELQDLYHAYVKLLEAGRDRILHLGGTCDPVDQMERVDPYLIRARRAIEALTTIDQQQEARGNGK